MAEVCRRRTRRRARRLRRPISDVVTAVGHRHDAVGDLPTVRTLEVNGVGRSAWIVGGAVVVTAAVGLVFSGLVAATGSLLAPAMVHVAANSGATVTAYWVLRKVV